MTPLLFMTRMGNNEFIQEDWERISELDKMYLGELYNEFENEWRQWEEYKPIEFNVIFTDVRNFKIKRREKLRQRICKNI